VKRRSNAKRWGETYRRHRHLFIAGAAKRRAAMVDRVPPWFGELDDLAVAEAADLASRRSALFGIPWEVDHFEPLLGKHVSGLHVATNLVVTTRRINRSSGNRPKPAMPFGLPHFERRE
jgi:hypothetical protein